MQPAKESDHASKIREARDARRKRILARSSERLAYITGEGKNTPHSSPSCVFLDVEPSSQPRKSDASRALAFEIRGGCSDESGKKALEDTGSILQSCQKELGLKHRRRDSASYDAASGEAVVETSADVHNPESPQTFQPSTNISNTRVCSSCFTKKLSCSIHYSLVPRLICAACIAVVLVGRATLESCGHSWGKTLSLFSLCWPIAIVFAMDFIFVAGALLLHPRGEEMEEMKSDKELLVQAPRRTKMAWSVNAAIVMKIVVAISLDCSVYASLLGAGLSLARYLLSSSCSFNRM